MFRERTNVLGIWWKKNGPLRLTQGNEEKVCHVTFIENKPNEETCGVKEPMVSNGVKEPVVSVGPDAIMGLGENDGSLDNSFLSDQMDPGDKRLAIGLSGKFWAD